MNLNKIILPNYKETKSDLICLRGKVNTGTACNYRCGFCYYKDRLDVPDKPFINIQKEINNLYSNGIREFDLSGGESSIHKDFFKIIKYGNEFGSVTTLSNGYKFADYEFLKESYDNGLSGILFSLHGWDSHSHDTKVGFKNAFDLIIKAIYNVKKLKEQLDCDFELRINCTVNEMIDCRSYAKLILDIEPDQLNILPINYWEDAISNKKINYELVGSRIRYLIDLIVDRIKSQIDINVRYMPLCFAKGFEKYIVNIYQHIFDLKDWNLQLYDNNIQTRNKKTTKENMFLTASNNRKNSFTKPSSCSACKYLYICDGIENKLLEHHELIPITGKKIKDINYLKDIK